MPRPIVAAPSPVIPLGEFHLAMLHGDDGSNFFRQLGPEQHPGFPEAIYAYNVVTDQWASFGTFPKDPARGILPPVTAPVVSWRGKWVIPSGEIRPRVRTPRVFWAEPVHDRASFGWLNSGVLVLYLVLLLAIGWWASGRMHTSADYFTASGRIPWLAAGLSIFSTQLSAITYLALPARAFATDWSMMLYNLGILLVAPLVIFCYLPVYRRLGVASVYEYLDQRFGWGMRLVGSIGFIVYQLGRTGIIILLPALALSAVTGIDLHLCLLLMGLLSTAYTVMGGMEAVVWTDVLQTVVLLGGGIAAVAIMAGGVDNGLSGIIEQGGRLGKTTMLHTEWDWAGDTVWVLALAAVFGNLIPYTSDQAVIQRYLSTADEGKTRRAIWTNALLSIPATFLFLLIGTCLFMFFRQHPASMTPIEKTDQVFPLFIASQMPAGLAGLVVAGVFAAAMSSIDSSIHSVATVITTDLHRRVLPGASEGQILRIARWLTIALGVLATGTAIFLAHHDIRYLWDFFLTLIGMVMGTVAGVFALGIFVQRARAVHAWIGLGCGIGLIAFFMSATRIHGLLFSVIGLGGTLLTGWLASAVLPGETK
jgi:SSS family transporter